MEFLSKINWHTIQGFALLLICALVWYLIIDAAIDAASEFLIKDIQTEMDCMKSHGIYLESDRVCVTQSEAYAMVERWPNYGGWGK